MFKPRSNIIKIRFIHTTTKVTIKSCNDVNKFLKIKRLNNIVFSYLKVYINIDIWISIYILNSNFIGIREV